MLRTSKLLGLFTISLCTALSLNTTIPAETKLIATLEYSETLPQPSNSNVVTLAMAYAKSQEKKVVSVDPVVIPTSDNKVIENFSNSIQEPIAPKVIVETPTNNSTQNTYPAVTSLALGEFYINIPKINVHNFWVSRGVGDEQSQLAVGGSLLQGTPYPNSYKGNAVIGAHREWENNWNPFYYIDHLVSGDIIEVNINGETLKYKVFDSYVINYNRAEYVGRDFGYPVLTLYSCTIPMSENRYVLHAKLVS